MNDFRSKLPDLHELTSIATKLYKDVRKSVCEIIEDYKQKRQQEETTTVTTVKKEETAAKPEAKAEEIIVGTKKVRKPRTRTKKEGAEKKDS